MHSHFDNSLSRPEFAHNPSVFLFNLGSVLWGIWVPRYRFPPGKIHNDTSMCTTIFNTPPNPYEVFEHQSSSNIKRSWRQTWELSLHLSLVARKHVLRGFPSSSAGKESPHNAGNPSSIPGLGRATGEGIGYLLQDSWASLVASLVKNPPAMRETWVQSLGWEDPLNGYPLQYCGLENSTDRGA